MKWKRLLGLVIAFLAVATMTTMGCSLLGPDNKPPDNHSEYNK